MTKYTDVRAYYVDKWGEPDREVVFREGANSVGVFKWTTGKGAQEANYYATLSGCDLIVPGHGEQHGREYFAVFSPEFDAIASPLAWLVIYGRRAGKAIEAGHIYRSQEVLSSDTDFAGFLFVEPLPNGPAPVELAGGRIIDFVMAVPAFTDELDYAREHGPRKLWQRMTEVRASYWDPGRTSVLS